ncbi:hypothetical protein chiPu_0008143 [Chiloscyllium punctatum]|uniref:Uncharacterized protein n=1 Tax=Chiloscyllium punctatum TaxID=137246 RepID=A0A401SH25_CHIPU|nr:hypothetical protein [Chiloscyllium punctatum]
MPEVATTPCVAVGPKSYQPFDQLAALGGIWRERERERSSTLGCIPAHYHLLTPGNKTNKQNKNATNITRSAEGEDHLRVN